MIRSLFLGLAALIALASQAEAGRNAGGALIAHTNDSVTYTTTGSYCGVDFDDPGSCENANTRTDKDGNTPAVIWFLAAFPSGSDPAVTGIQFGVDFNMPAGQGYVGASGPCGPNPQLLPTEGFPDTPGGALLGYGEAVADTLFPFFWYAVYGIDETSYFGTAEYPGGEAKFADDSVPPQEDAIEKFGTVRWYSAGTNECPADGDGDGGPDGPGGEDEWLDGDGERQWVRDCILVQLRDDLPMPPGGPVDELGLPAFDALGSKLGVVSVRRLLTMDDETCSRYPGMNRMVVLRFGANTNELEAAHLYAQLTEVAAAQPNYFAPNVGLSASANDPAFHMQWHLVGPDAASCRDDDLNPQCREGCDIGVDVAWQYTRGDSAVRVAFIDTGADMQHPDLFDAYAFNPAEDANGNGRADLCDYPIGDIDGIDADADADSVVDDVLLGWALGLGGVPTWKHRPNWHGTNVAGLLGAITNNGTGAASAAGGDQDSLGIPGIRLIRFSAYAGVTSKFQIETFAYAHDHGARIYSSSHGSLLDDSAVRRAVDSLSDDILFLQAVGNEADTSMIGFARLANVVAVGGYDGITGGRWVTDEYEVGPLGSNYGPKLELMGPAADNLTNAPYSRMVMASTWPTHLDNVYECDPDWPDSVGCFGGTSAATPIVASVAALVESYSREHGPGLTASQVRKILTRTAEDIRCDPLLAECDCSDSSECVELLGRDQYSGYGRVDAGRALTLPVAALDPLSPYEDFVIWNGEARLSWETLDLNPSNGGTPDHLEIHYLVPEDGEGWHVLADSLPWNGDPRFEWTVPDSFAVGDNRYFRLSVVDSAGTTLNADYRRFSVLATTAADSEVDAHSSVLGIWPNPSPGSVRVRFTLVAPSMVRVEVFDVSGRRVRTLVHEREPSGLRTVDWDGRDESGHRVASGIYFIRLDLGSTASTKRLVRIH